MWKLIVFALDLPHEYFLCDAATNLISRKKCFTDDQEKEKFVKLQKKTVYWAYQSLYQEFEFHIPQYYVPKVISTDPEAPTAAVLSLLFLSFKNA
ncbi:hypothetical protein Bhyg_04085 [Pseudolycoriella hygida]|uniref:Uncharacterized protein n=1 Tax=Pseudolycoriella hygida TaxID=35572 RepID=A0A9Q0NER9_9DIPT|nr:hypothetical protein Bhyg_04085 [Pseudolycoriella hygida]